MSDEEKSEAVSLTGMFADAVLYAKRHLEEAEAIRISGARADGFIPMTPRVEIEVHLGLSKGWSSLAQALQHGAPGQRF